MVRKRKIKNIRLHSEGNVILRNRLIGVIVANLSAEPFTIADGDRIAQMVVARHETVCWEAVERLDDTARGDGGFGHTGV